MYDRQQPGDQTFLQLSSDSLGSRSHRCEPRPKSKRSEDGYPLTCRFSSSSDMQNVSGAFPFFRGLAVGF
jgi:hypothetical protein